MIRFSGLYGTKDNIEQRDLIKGTEYFIRRDRYEVLAIKFEIIWDEKTV